MTFRVMTYNILDGGGDREPLILQVLRETEPDVVVLQEVFDTTPIESLAEALEMDYFFARGNNVRHLALLSRFPIKSAQSYHPLPIRCAILEAQVELSPDYFINLFGVHLAPYIAFYREWWRALETRVLLKRTAAVDGDPCLILGDFNAIAPNDRVEWTDDIPPYLKRMLWLQRGRVFHLAIGEILKAGFTDCFRELHGQKDGFTLPPPEPHVRLDYMFVNDQLKDRLKYCDVVLEGSAVHLASDHYPLLAEFEI